MNLDGFLQEPSAVLAGKGGLNVTRMGPLRTQIWTILPDFSIVVSATGEIS